MGLRTADQIRLLTIRRDVIYFVSISPSIYNGQLRYKRTYGYVTDDPKKTSLATLLEIADDYEAVLNRGQFWLLVNIFVDSIESPE